MGTDRSLLSVTVAVVAGVIVTIVANQMGHGGDLLSPREYLAPKGVIYGSVIAIVVFGITRLFVISPKARAWGLLSAAIVSGLFGLLVLTWNISWGFSPTSLEGAWTWPLAIVPLVLSFVSFKGWRRARRADEIAGLPAAKKTGHPSSTTTFS